MLFLQLKKIILVFLFKSCYIFKIKICHTLKPMTSISSTCYAISGPIGAILAPGLDMKKNADLPFASTLCGSCSNVCPVKIDIHDQLYKWRQVLVQNKNVSNVKKTAMIGLSFIFSNPRIYKPEFGIKK